MITEVAQRPQVIWVVTKQFLVRCDRFGEGILAGIVALEAIIAAYNKEPLSFADCFSQCKCAFEACTSSATVPVFQCLGIHNVRRGEIWILIQCLHEVVRSRD